MHTLVTANVRQELLAHGFPTTDVALGAQLVWRELLRKEAHISALGDVFLVQVGRIPHWQIMDSLKLIGKYVMPYFMHGNKCNAAENT